MKLERNLVFIDATLATKAAVIDFLGGKLVASGAVQAAYVEAMHQREQDIGTYITEGVAVPHGTVESRALVQRPAVAVLKLPHGVDWDNGNTVYLAFGIAGNNNEHVALLGSLAGLLMDEDDKEKLMTAVSEDELFGIIDAVLG